MRTASLILILYTIFCIYSCQKPIENTNCNNSKFHFFENENYGKLATTNDYSNNILILNEGGFTYGNASIDAYDANSREVKHKIFEHSNQFALGDIAQSIFQSEELSYVVVNNSQKLEIVNTKSFERKATITGFSSPRYLSFDQNSEALISDLYEQSLNVLNLETGCTVTTIATKGWTEEILKVNSNYWIIERNGIGVENKFANLLLVNSDSWSISDRIAIQPEPNSVIMDNNDNIWVLSNGIEDKNIFPSLIKFNTHTKSIEKSFFFTSYNAQANNLAYHASTEDLYYNIGAKIYRFNTIDLNLPNNFEWQSSAQNIYNIAVDPQNKDIYICDALDYISNGIVLRYNDNGDLIDEFETGVIPSKIIF